MPTTFHMEARLFAKILCSAVLLLAPSALMAQQLSETHEVVSMPGKSVPMLRPVTQVKNDVAFCHPETSKATTCLGHARARAQALADAAPHPTQLSER